MAARSARPLPRGVCSRFDGGLVVLVAAGVIVWTGAVVAPDPGNVWLAVGWALAVVAWSVVDQLRAPRLSGEELHLGRWRRRVLRPDDVEVVEVRTAAAFVGAWSPPSPAVFVVLRRPERPSAGTAATFRAEAFVVARDFTSGVVQVPGSLFLGDARRLEW